MKHSTMNNDALGFSIQKLRTKKAEKSFFTERHARRKHDNVSMGITLGEFDGMKSYGRCSIGCGDNLC